MQPHVIVIYEGFDEHAQALPIHEIIGPFPSEADATAHIVRQGIHEAFEFDVLPLKAATQA